MDTDAINTHVKEKNLSSTMDTDAIKTLVKEKELSCTVDTDAITTLVKEKNLSYTMDIDAIKTLVKENLKEKKKERNRIARIKKRREERVAKRQIGQLRPVSFDQLMENGRGEPPASGESTSVARVGDHLIPMMAEVRNGEKNVREADLPGTSSNTRIKNLNGHREESESDHRKLLRWIGGYEKSAGLDSLNYNSTTDRENQIVILSNREGGIITPDEGERLKTHLVAEMMRAMTGPDGGAHGPELRFRNSNLIELGWFLITPQDKISKWWLLFDWGVLVEGDVEFRALPAVSAPWPQRIGFNLESQEVDLPKITQMLALQNRSLGIDKWRHQETIGAPGQWRLTFWVSQNTVKILEDSGWVLYYELMRLQVQNVTAYEERSAARGSRSS